MRARLEWLRGEVQAYEDKYSMSSTSMRNRLAKGEIFETDDTCRWNMVINEMRRLEKKCET